MDFSSIDRCIQESARPLIVVLGPTASGKTTYSIDLALYLQNAEVVNADSRQLYTQLDIGTAKVTPEEMQGVPHHLLDVLDPKKEVSIAWYQKEATKCIDALHAAKKVPLLVGGSMLYISAIIDGLTLAPAADPVVRTALGRRYDEDKGESLYRELLEIDPDCAQAFHQHNKPYVIRAMEIYTATGEKPSSVKMKTSCPYDLYIVGMHWEREVLTERINTRTRQLLERGWIDEVQGLLDAGYEVTDPGMKSHGYREIVTALERGSIDREMLYEDIAAKTRQYAKRQMTWWRRDERICWIHHPR